MIKTSIRSFLEAREEGLSRWAARSRTSRGRMAAEEPPPTRTEFQRDRDRIIHSKSFRRLKHKTQVFIAPLGDHYVTRLTHTLEVAQVARTIARALNLNEDLAEAIALGHDLGHTPFGHVGEEELDGLHPTGFRHSQQSLRIVDRLEKDGEGLNLTWEVRQGIEAHSKPRGDFLGAELPEGLTLEAQICRIADAVAYLNHDLADAFRAGILDGDGLPSEVERVLGRRHSERVDTMVNDIIRSSSAANGLEAPTSGEPPPISIGPEVRQAVNTLREFMFERVYMPESEGEEGQAARRIIGALYRYFDTSRGEIPTEYSRRSRSEEQEVADYISGMTDQYALRAAHDIQPGLAEIFRSRLL